MKNEFEKYGQVINGMINLLVLFAKFTLMDKQMAFTEFCFVLFWLNVKSTVRVICDHMSGKSKGYGFVLFDSEEAVASALASMNNQVCYTKLSQNRIPF